MQCFVVVVVVFVFFEVSVHGSQFVIVITHNFNMHVRDLIDFTLVSHV